MRMHSKRGVTESQQADPERKVNVAGVAIAPYNAEALHSNSECSDPVALIQYFSLYCTLIVHIFKHD
jgi:hypothetical protein